MKYPSIDCFNVLFTTMLRSCFTCKDEFLNVLKLQDFTYVLQLDFYNELLASKFHNIHWTLIMFVIKFRSNHVTKANLHLVDVSRETIGVSCRFCRYGVVLFWSVWIMGMFIRSIVIRFKSCYYIMFYLCKWNWDCNPVYFA